MRTLAFGAVGLTAALVTACGGGAGTEGDDALDGSTDGTAGDGFVGSVDGTADGGDAGVGHAGPVELYRGPGSGGVIPGWDPEAPRPVLMMNRGFRDDAWRATNALIAADGTMTNLADHIIVWGFDASLQVVYDGDPGAGAIPGWSDSEPPPLIMMGTGGTIGDAWMPLTTGEAIDGAGRVFGTSATRVIVWGWGDPQSTPPSELHFGPNDGNFLMPGWDHALPVPFVLWGRADHEIVWHAHSVAVFPDRSLDPTVPGQLRIFGWSSR